MHGTTYQPHSQKNPNCPYITHLLKISHKLEQRLMSLPELTPEKIIKLQKNDTFCNNIIHHIHCNTNKNYFTDAMGISHKKVIDFNRTFSSVVIPKILIKYLLHASHDSLGHIGATKLYHFFKRLYYFQGMWKTVHRYVRTSQICQIMNLQKKTISIYTKILLKPHKVTYQSTS